MSIHNRLNKLEQRTSPSAKPLHYIATPNLDNDMVLDIKQLGNPNAPTIAMSLDEYALWLKSQPDSVVYRLAYPNEQ